MLRKIFLISILILLLLIGSLFIFVRHSRVPSRMPANPTSAADTSSPENGGWPVPRGVRTHLHPLATEAKLAEAKKQPVETWDEWMDATVEVILAEAILYGNFKSPYLTTYWVEDSTEEVVSKRTWLRESLTWYRKRLEWWLKPPPAYPGGLIDYTQLDEYQGPHPPTGASLLDQFEAVYKDKNPKAGYLDEHYPKEAWLNTLLEKGAHIEDYNDFKFLLKVRQSLLRQKENPEEWISGKDGIPITTNFEEYADGFIDRKIWEYSIVQKVRAENPGTSPTVFFKSNDPDKYFPSVGSMAYVNIGEHRESMSTMGALLTEKQRDDLLKKGIEPEDIEIIYLDDDNNIISQPPPLVDNRQPDYENIIAFDGIKVTPENYKQLLGRPAPEKWLEKYDTLQDTEILAPPNDSELEAIRAAAREAAESAHEAAKVEFEKFQNSMRQLEEFSTMSDVEIEKALERQFRQKFLPEHPVEQFTPERLEEALGTLFKHGFEKGFRRVKRDSPALANQLERYFGTERRPPQKSKPSQRSAPPRPPEAPPPE